MELKEGGGVWIVSFSEVSPFEESVSTILSLIEAKNKGLVSNKNVQANRGGSTAVRCRSLASVLTLVSGRLIWVTYAWAKQHLFFIGKFISFSMQSPMTCLLYE